MPDHVCHPSVRQDPNIHREERTPWKVNFVVLHIVIFKACFGAFKSWVLRCELYSGHSHCLSYEMRTWATPLGQLKEKPTRIPLLMQATWVPLDNSTYLRNLSLQSSSSTALFQSPSSMTKCPAAIFFSGSHFLLKFNHLRMLL